MLLAYGKRVLETVLDLGTMAYLTATCITVIKTLAFWFVFNAICELCQHESDFERDRATSTKSNKIKTVLSLQA